MNKETFRLVSKYDCVLDKKKKYCYFAHNKVAQTTINRHLLKHRSIVRKDNKAYWNIIEEQYYREWDSIKPFTFTIVRNPYDKALSAFLYLQQKANIISKNKIFSDFVLNDLYNGKEFFDPHFEWQINKYKRDFSSLELDRVIKLENIDEEWKSLSQIIGCTSHLCKTNSSFYDYKKYYTKQAKEMVYQIYYDDFKELNYSPFRCNYD